ncbi:flagellar motor protein MotB [Parvularcula sp. IMCC14364]|uniref:flagellar motor protein MotB n=1 Tax=Parvularcula sp. IMCC14364 TaxID=3067902 RepID=UPI0027409152|nr:flagellar motor protein MotB [Parvularcula sp. IMCC14364]
MAEALQPIIKKKKVIAGGGHHGGAWKVAYADFVTAMMAFFLLMWLLNATTEDQRKGIADYFNPTIPISRISGGGADALSGDSIYTEETLARDGTGARQKENAINESSGAGEKDGKSPAEDQEAVSEKAAQLAQAIDESKNNLSEHLQIKMSPDGMVIELVESDKRPLFAVGNAKPSALLQELLGIVSASFDDVQNDIKIVGHTDANSFAANAAYTNWELSTDRANTARRVLLQAGFPQSQITEVSGKADTDPLSDDPFAPENRRISITILK